MSFANWRGAELLDDGLWCITWIFLTTVASVDGSGGVVSYYYIEGARVLMRSRLGSEVVNRHIAPKCVLSTSHATTGYSLR